MDKMKNINWLKLFVWLTYFLMLAMAALGFASCNPVKQATKKYTQAKEKSLETVADLARKDFPCTSIRVDTIKGKDSIIIKEKEVPQYVEVRDTIVIDGKPVIKTQTKYVNCNCRDSIIYKPQYITKTVEDSAKILVANAQRDKAAKDVNKYQSRAKTKGWIIAVLIGLFIAYILLTKTFKIF